MSLLGGRTSLVMTSLRDLDDRVIVGSATAASRDQAFLYCSASMQVAPA
jgi:hypothetical protein